MRKQGQFVFYRVESAKVMALLSALAQVGEAHDAEIQRLVRLFFFSKDDFEPVAATEVLERARKGLVTVLDVRPPEEFAAGHVPGALNIPVDQLEKRLRELPKRREVIAYCRGPFCLMSFDAVQLLRKMGIKARRLERHARVAGGGTSHRTRGASRRLNRRRAGPLEQSIRNHGART